MPERGERPSAAAPLCTAGRPASIPAVTEIARRPLTEQLEELGAQLAWVREYL